MSDVIDFPTKQPDVLETLAQNTMEKLLRDADACDEQEEISDRELVSNLLRDHLTNHALEKVEQWAVKPDVSNYDRVRGAVIDVLDKIDTDFNLVSDRNIKVGNVLIAEGSVLLREDESLVTSFTRVERLRQEAAGGLKHDGD